MPYSAAVIAYAFVKRGIKEGKPVTQMKLQKMVYFAHGYHLAMYGAPLIEEEFEAWKYGPVIPSIYRRYQLYGSEEINDLELIFDVSDLETALLNLSYEAHDAIDYTWEATKNLSAVQLSAWTHKAGSPWAEAFKPDVKSIPIKNDRIGQYFTGFLSN
ncbi:Panacea domain-containing protein [Puia dinghuensis]|uniref:Antitoxin SocA-like Panacea domain-containing protein n=1 Tax=Puia dinghuensis TaxID=1792502 RepID=A0A8J2UF34_9BACT|nr:type II toxin-antitoxin system antitoxin SocA domain-containing protein [Puia dinghuensis]GGB08112.1 hypothetical protein GCM10011511_34580 [Puia dinghuensis]